jgi:RNA-directed DNA polymerase
MKWRIDQYFGRFNVDRSDSWVFGDKQTGAYLLQLKWFPIERHIQVKGKASPDDPHLREYWMRRQEAKAKDLPSVKQQLSKKQKGQCGQCCESLFNGEDIQVHRRLSSMGKEKIEVGDLALVHTICHQQIHADTKLPLQPCLHFNHLTIGDRESKKTSESQQEKEPRCT